MNDDGKKPLRCSFCGKHEQQVRRMIQGPGVRICDECVRLCMSILDDGFDDLVATPLPERGSDCNVHDCPFFKALDHTASGPAIKDRLQPGSVLVSTLSRLSTELAGSPPGSQPRAGGASRQPLTAPAIKPLT